MRLARARSPSISPSASLNGRPKPQQSRIKTRSLVRQRGFVAQTTSVPRRGASPCSAKNVRGAHRVVSITQLDTWGRISPRKMAFRPHTASTSKQACPSSTLHIAHRPNRLGEEAWCYLQCVFPLALENQCRHGRAGIDQVEKSRREFWKYRAISASISTGSGKVDNQSRKGRMPRSPQVIDFNGAPYGVEPSSLPASTAITGSWRR